jgi:hypothetical protein
VPDLGKRPPSVQCSVFFLVTALRDNAIAESPESEDPHATRELDSDVQAAVAVVVRLANYLRVHLDL